MSIAALLMSITSLGCSMYAIYRDRYKLEASAEYLESFANMADAVIIRIANVGRRPSSPRQLIAYCPEAERFVHLLREGGKPIVLSESAYYEIVLDCQQVPLADWPLEKINRWEVLDSRGFVYPVKNGASVVKAYAKHMEGTS